MAWWDSLAEYIPSPRSDEEEALLQRRARQHKANMANLPEGELLPDIAKSAASGARSGLESVAGIGGDINHMVAALASYGAGKAGYDPEAAAGAVEEYSPLSWLPDTEEVGQFTDDVIGRDEITRHTPKTGYGDLAAGTTNLASSLVSGPETLVGKLGMAMLPAVKRGAKIAGKAGDVPKPKVDGTIGDLDNPDVLFEGVSPHDFTDTEQWHRFGNEYGVPNLGSPNKADWEASLAPFKTNSGQDFTVPGGVGNKDPFTYFDILHLKAQGINPNDIPPELHQGIHDRFLATMSPEGEVSPERLMNQMSLGQISPNQPLSPNELAVGRTMVKGPEDIEKLGGMVPWRHDDPDMAEQASKVVGTKQVKDKKTGEISTKDVKAREELSGVIANKLGLGAGSGGGLGARGTADYTRVAETAQKMKEDPGFFRFRGSGEGGGGAEHASGNWRNFVERLMNQVPGLSSKTGSFAGVWQNPAKANISAVDRHMAGKFTAEMFPSPEAYEAFKEATVAKFAKNNPGSGPISFEALPQADKNDAMFGYLNNSGGGMKTRLKPEKGSNSGVGPENPNLPEHLKADNAQWINEPDKIERISEPYGRVLDANAEVANEAGQSTFGSQWMLWDRIRNRLEPHEIMFPGLEKLPRMSMEQFHRANRTLKDAGYMSSSKEIDPRTGEKKLTPVRRMPSASEASYFVLPAAAAVGGGSTVLDVLEEREREKRGGRKSQREEG
jgi:hypothetical protein